MQSQTPRTIMSLASKIKWEKMSIHHTENGKFKAVFQTHGMSGEEMALSLEAYEWNHPFQSAIKVGKGVLDEAQEAQKKEA